MSADQAMEVVLDTVRTEINGAASFITGTLLAGKGGANPTLVMIRPELGDRGGQAGRGGPILRRGRLPAGGAPRAEPAHVPEVGGKR